MDLLPVHIAVLTIADQASEDRSAAGAIVERARAAGHTIVDEETVKDAEGAIRDQLVRWIAEPNIDVVIVAASVETESAAAALAPLVMHTLPGFTDLFRWLTFQEIGASAMLSAAEAAQCESTFVFVLPAHAVAVRAAMDKLILPQLDARTRPKNLVTQMPRLKDAAKRVQAAPQAVPTPVAVEKTQGGSGVLPKPPALPDRPKTRTANTIARKQDDPPTKPIDLAKLEKQIALSNVNDAQTKEVNIGAHDAKTKVVDMSAHQAKTRVVDMTGRVLPRVPPGADESAADGDEPLSFQPPAPAAVAKATPLPSITKPATGTTPPAVKTPPAVSVPSFATPVARTPASPPITPRKEVVTPVSPASQVIAARDQAITPVSPLPVVRPPVHVPTAASDVPTPPVDLQAMPAVRAAEPAAGESSEHLETIDAIEAVEAPVPRPRPRTPTPPPPPPVRDFDKVDAPLSAALTQPPVKRKPTQPPPIDPLAAVTSKPLGVVDLPEGDFDYPIKKSGGALVLKIVGALALLGVGFFAVVQLFPRDTPSTQTAAVEPAPAPAPAATPPIDAAEAADAVLADAEEPEPIEIEPAPVAAAAPSSPVSRKPGRGGAVTRPEPAPAGELKPPSEPAPKQAEPSSDPSCDEVSCVLSKYDRPCCERYRPTESFTPTTGTPEELDKRLVKTGVEKIKPKVVACGEQAATSGTVKLAVTVDPDGAVKNVSVTESPTPALGECVAGAMRKAKFAKTIKGGEFVYPFVF